MPAITNLLHSLGLDEVMATINHPDFRLYVPKDYPGSERESMDEVYRMSELVLLHERTGLRLEYLRSESYYGDDVRYRLRSVFIITLTGEKLEVLDLAEEKQCFTTPAGVVGFDQVIKTVEK
jgi:hypothetical protein